MDDDEELKEGLKKSMSESAKKKYEMELTEPGKDTRQEAHEKEIRNLSRLDKLFRSTDPDAKRREEYFKKHGSA